MTKKIYDFYTQVATKFDDEFFLFKRNVTTNQMVHVGYYRKSNGISIHLGYPNPRPIDSSKSVNMYDSGFYIKDGNYDGVMNIGQECYLDDGFYIVTPTKYDKEQFTEINANHPEFPHYTIGFTTHLSAYLEITTKTLVTLWDYYIIKNKE